MKIEAQTKMKAADVGEGQVSEREKVEDLLMDWKLSQCLTSSVSQESLAENEMMKLKGTVKGAIVVVQISVQHVAVDPLVQCVDVARWTYIEKNTIVKSFLLIDGHGTHWYVGLPYSRRILE